MTLLEYCYNFLLNIFSLLLVSRSSFSHQLMSRFELEHSVALYFEPDHNQPTSNSIQGNINLISFTLHLKATVNGTLVQDMTDKHNNGWLRAYVIIVSISSRSWYYSDKELFLLSDQ
jgi:hypothetical protein